MMCFDSQHPGTFQYSQKPNVQNIVLSMRRLLGIDHAQDSQTGLTTWFRVDTMRVSITCVRNAFRPSGKDVLRSCSFFEMILAVI